MAAGFMDHLAEGRIDVFSGGSEPVSSLNPSAVTAMAERGIDISAQTPKPWNIDMIRAADVVVTMGCGDSCPLVPGKRYLDWELDDPSQQPLEAVRRVRDQIEGRVKALLNELIAPT